MQDQIPASAMLPTDSDAAALSQMGFSNMIQHLDVAGWVVFLTLVIMSLLSWFYIVNNFFRNTAVRARADKVVRGFWSSDTTQEAIQYMERSRATSRSPRSPWCAEAAAYHQKHDGSRMAEALNRSEFIDRALRQAVTRESSRLEGGLTLLATVGSSAPFIGLLGTVWGIYRALIAIGATGKASIDAIAGPIGEALIMTALGLFVAIPALLAYNGFVRQNRVTLAKFDEFAHDLHDYFATGARVGSNKA